MVDISAIRENLESDIISEIRIMSDDELAQLAEYLKLNIYDYKANYIEGVIDN